MEGRENPPYVLATEGKTKYFLLMEELKEDIISGKLKPGDKLPSENELSGLLSCEPPYSQKSALDSGAGRLCGGGARARDLCIEKSRK